MNPNEKFVLKALERKFGGNITEGKKDPPDAYLHIDGRKIAVEVTRLVEQVRGKNEKRTSRMTQDIPAVKLADDIDEEMQDYLPNGMYALIIVPAPINNIRRTKEVLISVISDMVENGPRKSEVEIEGNLISISTYDGARPSGKKVIGAVINRYSSANISENSKIILEDRISIKNKKCKPHLQKGEYWLALYND